MKTTRALSLFVACALLGLLFLVLPAPIARATPSILRVATSGTTTWPCGQSDWSSPCTLDTALAHAAYGDELWVAAGTYTPTVGATRTATFQLQPGVALYGGFAGGESLRSQRNFTTNLTILSGDLSGNDNGNIVANEPTRTDNAYHVVTASNVTNTAVLDGFTVTGGNGSEHSYPDDRGGGMVAYYSSPTLSNVVFSSNSAFGLGAGFCNTSGSPTLTNVTFISNTAGSFGGGMFNNSGSPMLTNVTFFYNHADGGGGISNFFSSPTLTNVTFNSNTTTSFGGGMQNENSSSPTLTNVTFATNSSDWVGGGMYNNNSSSPTLTNVTFVSNTTSSYGGGIRNDWQSNPTLTNVTFATNSSGWQGGGISNSNSSSPTVRNTIFWGNTAPNGGAQIYNDTGTPSLSDSIVQGGYAGGTRIIADDPRLGVLGDWGGSAPTVPLLPGSSAVDRGNGATCAPTDQRGKPRVGTCDIGAFEFQGYELTETGGDQQSSLVNTPFANSLQVTLTEIDSALLLPGAVVTFTATSSGASAAWSGSPVVTATTNASGVATVGPPTANGAAGSYTVTATIFDANPHATFALTNIKANTTTMITSSENPVSAGHPVTFTVTVSAVAPANTTATGTVELSETSPAGATVRGRPRALASQPLVNGVATFSVSSLTPGTHTFLASYGGDAIHIPSTSAIYTQTVGVLSDYLPLIRR